MVLAVLNASLPLDEEDRQLLEDTKDAPRIIVLNQCDKEMVLDPKDFNDPVVVSAQTGAGLAELEKRVAAFGAGAGESALTQQRHMTLAREAAASLRAAADACARGEAVDLAVIDLQDALASLGRITGEQVDDKMIDEIFERFCVGK